MPLRVGIVNYLNSRPLAWGFLQGEQVANGLFTPRFLPPSRVADELAGGEIDVGLIPSIEVQRIPDLKVLPGLCIAALQEVRSVLLVSRVPIEQTRRVALDENSRTSAALVRIVLEDRHGLQPEYTSHRADLGAMLATNDAALLIGDPALRVDRSKHHVLDLAAEWKTMSGHPFVFALWAVRESVAASWLLAQFHESLRLGMREIDRIAEQAAIELGLESTVLHRYLTESLHFHLGPDEIRGLQEFYRRAHEKGLIGPPRPLALLQDAAATSAVSDRGDGAPHAGVRSPGERERLR